VRDGWHGKWEANRGKDGRVRIRIASRCCVCVGSPWSFDWRWTRIPRFVLPSMSPSSFASGPFGQSRWNACPSDLAHVLFVKYCFPVQLSSNSGASVSPTTAYVTILSLFQSLLIVSSQSPAACQLQALSYPMRSNVRSHCA
jgi:hypothetical protein